MTKKDKDNKTQQRRQTYAHTTNMNKNIHITHWNTRRHNTTEERTNENNREEQELRKEKDWINTYKTQQD